MFAEESTAGITLQGFKICSGSSGSACGDPKPGPSACDSGSRSKSLLIRHLESTRTGHCVQVSAVPMHHAKRCLDDV